ncbi:transmembrane protein 231-like [Eriocheir sinensis]|uniref:transmembrane protein 231-like n=1 Tax=Eriocheir sinensis TaxID=95602 RepID=UPI0021C5F3BE|nr:transmembrane protein 231-like [Eriocheir sinensis]
MWVVHQQPCAVYHKATVCSKATCFTFLTFLVTLMVPLLLVYRSQGLWVKEIHHREQPDVQFKHEMLLTLNTQQGSLVWSTLPAFNTLMAQHLRVPLLQSHEEDQDHDGVQEGLELQVSVPLAAKELVYGATLTLTFYYALHQNQVVLEGLAHIQYQSGVPLAAVHTWGDLTLNQRTPLPPTGTYDVYNKPAMPTSVSAADWRLDNILAQYWERNITTRLTNTYSVQKTGAGGDSFTLTLHLRYPPQLVWYIPSLALLLKGAWIQYLSVLILVAYVTSSFKHWVFSSRLLPTWLHCPQNSHQPCKRH